MSVRIIVLWNGVVSFQDIVHLRCDQSPHNIVRNAYESFLHWTIINNTYYTELITNIIIFAFNHQSNLKLFCHFCFAWLLKCKSNDVLSAHIEKKYYEGNNFIIWLLSLSTYVSSFLTFPKRKFDKVFGQELPIIILITKLFDLEGMPKHYNYVIKLFVSLTDQTE
jgi:hypothetical protein